MGKEFRITQEAIEAAAAQCPTAKEVLRAMFPEAFEKKVKLVGGGIYRSKAGNLYLLCIDRLEYVLVGIKDVDRYMSFIWHDYKNHSPCFDRDTAAKMLKDFTYLPDAKIVVEE